MSSLFWIHSDERKRENAPALIEREHLTAAVTAETEETRRIFRYLIISVELFKVRLLP